MLGIWPRTGGPASLWTYTGRVSPPIRLASRGRLGAQSQLPSARRLQSTTSGSGAPSRSRRWVRRFGVLIVFGGGVYAYDKQVGASAISRSVRTAWIGLLCTLDYKLNFSPEKADQIENLHQRVADRLRWVIDTNQGLYLKLGQALGLQAALLPKPYREAFGHVFDKAPSVPYSEVVGVFQRDLNVDPDDLFETFSHEPLASASIAQVHKAVLKTGEGAGKVVAVKVQKPAIEKQMEWDLFSYRSLMWVCEKLFDMPMYFVAKYVSKQMKNETNFEFEAANARRCAELVSQTSQLGDDVYVPRVFGEDEGCRSSERIMITEWVDGCRLNDRAALEKMGLKTKDVMDLVISTWGAMTFSWGFLHCDPHPGNILVRPHPRKKGKPQIVIIDHGLYIESSTEFREDYCSLWRSLFTLDIPTIERIAKKWGIALDPNMFATAILLRPFQVTRKGKEETKVEPEKSKYEQQVELKARFKTMLENEQLIPRELIFIARCQRMMQANNQLLGSPSNRINLTAKWASIGYTKSLNAPRTIARVGLGTWLSDRFRMFILRITLGFSDLIFLANRTYQYLLPKAKRKGWEDQLQAQFESIAKEEFGIELEDDVFLG